MTTDPMKVTREHLTEVAQVWKDYAQAKLAPYLDKLPESMGRYVKSRFPGAPAVAGESVDATAS
jgi:hypothetical protein